MQLSEQSTSWFSRELIFDETRGFRLRRCGDFIARQVSVRDIAIMPKNCLRTHCRNMPSIAKSANNRVASDAESISVLVGGGV